MSAHTPYYEPPWQYFETLSHYTNAHRKIWGAKGPGHGVVAEVDWCISKEEAIKIARLIRAAPEMFELLKQVYEEFSFDMSGDMDTRIYELIKKIEGESPHDPDKRDNNQ